MLKKLKKISGETKFSNPWWNYNIDNYFMPNGEKGVYHYVDSRGSTMVIPKYGDKFLLTAQYRYLNSKVSLEFPGGGIQPGIQPDANAGKELREETGYKAGELLLLGSFNPFKGVTNEICHVYLAGELSPCGNKPDDSEEFEIYLMTENDIIDKINKGEIWDGMTISAWSLYYFSKR